MRPFRSVTDFMQGQEYSAIGAVGAKISTLMSRLRQDTVPVAWEMGMITRQCGYYLLLGPENGPHSAHSSLRWNQMPTVVRQFRDSVLLDMSRFDLEDTTLVYSALCHPGFKHFDWVTDDDSRMILLKGFLRELSIHEHVDFEDEQFNPALYSMVRKRYINSSGGVYGSISVHQADPLLADDEYFESSQDSSRASESVCHNYACVTPYCISKWYRCRNFSCYRKNSANTYDAMTLQLLLKRPRSMYYNGGKSINRNFRLCLKSPRSICR